MLVIRRRPGEIVHIGETVEVKILESSPAYVKLGIQAPPEVVILRREVYLTQQRNRAASELDPESVFQIGRELQDDTS